MLTSAQLADARSEELSVARHALRANLTWTPLPASSFGLALRYVGRRREDDASSGLAPRVGATQGSYGACDISVRHAFGTRWRMVAQVESIVHRDREPGSSPPPPRVRGTLGVEGAF
jgi:outer membrane cobalamin receptor